MSEITFASLSPQLQRDIVHLIAEGREAIVAHGYQGGALSAYQRCCAAGLLLSEMLDARMDWTAGENAELRDVARRVIHFAYAMYLTQQVETS